MAYKCEITGKGVSKAYKVSHAHNRTKKKIKANLQTVRVWLDGRRQTIRVSTAAIRAGLIVKAPRGSKPPAA